MVSVSSTLLVVLITGPLRGALGMIPRPEGAGGAGGAEGAARRGAGGLGAGGLGGGGLPALGLGAGSLGAGGLEDARVDLGCSSSDASARDSTWLIGAVRSITMRPSSSGRTKRAAAPTRSSPTRPPGTRRSRHAMNCAPTTLLDAAGSRPLGEMIQRQMPSSSSR
jgi:hypothetical protein